MKSLIISASSDAGVSIDGAKDGALKLGKYLENLNKEVIYIKNRDNFVKDKNPLNKRKNEEEINIFNEKLYQTIIENKDKFPFTIGGDHAIAIGSALASQKNHGNIGIIWFDAHPDYNTFKTTITGNIHGLPLASITGFDNASLTNFHHSSFVKYENTVIVGARSIDKEELVNLKKAGIKVFTTEDIKNLGIEKVLNETLKIASQNTLGIHISYDLDVIDPKLAPGVSVPESEGINLEDAYKAIDILFKDVDKIVSLDLVEFNPLFDQDDKTYNIACNLINNIISKIDSKKF